MTEIIQKKRTLGRSGIKVSPLGMGCWAIGGPFYQADGTPVGWGASDDAESCRALETAYEQGITFYDTADIYGTGHSETLVGKVFANKRDKVVIATKFGFTFKTKTGTGDTDKRIADGMDCLARLHSQCLRSLAETPQYRLHRPVSVSPERLFAAKSGVRARYFGRPGALGTHPCLRLEHRLPGACRGLCQGAKLCGHSGTSECFG